MSELSYRTESIGLAVSPTTSAGQIDTPNQQSAAQSGGDPLSSPQRAAKIGDPVPIVFGRRVGNAGGVLVSPPATEARFENDATNAVTASYHLVISEGQIDPIQVRDVFQQSCRVGAFTQAYNRRAGSWGPGNFITTQTGFEDQVPDCPIYCGTATGSYAGMTTGSFVVTIPNGFDQWNRQVHAFLRGGMWVPRLLEGESEGPSNNVADLVRWLLRRSSRVPEALIDQATLLTSARFTNANGLWCNIRIDQPSNLADWLTKHLGYFLLRESRVNGRKGLRPLLPFNAATGAINTGPVPWSFTFDEDFVMPGSVQINYTSRVERAPFCVQVLWRQQPDDGLGLARTAEIRYGGSALDGPFEQHDLSAFATTEDHAFKVGAYTLARRRYIDHRLSLKLRPGIFNGHLEPGDIVRVRLKRVASIGGYSEHDYLYEVDRVGRAVMGELQLELTHMPVDDQGRSLVALDVSRAQGNGILLPPGRASVSCDINDAQDTSSNADGGPWGGWDVGPSDPPLYDLGDAWPDGVDDTGDGWGPGGSETEGGLGVGNGDGSGGQEPVEDGYTTEVSFSSPYIVYPEVWYALLTPSFASVSVDVTVSNPPVDGSLSLVIEDGSLNAFDPENGQFGGSNAYTVVIPEGETEATLTINAQGDSFTGTTSRLLAVTGWIGGGFQDSIDPDTQEVTPAVDASATQAFNIEPYVGSITLQQPGIWTHDGSGWVWAGSESTGDFTFDAALQQWEWTGTATGWDWDQADQRWSYTGAAVTGWQWLPIQQRWLRNVEPSAAAAKPADPPAGPPSPLPSEVTPAGNSYTVVAQSTIDKPAIPNGANNLAVDLTDFEDDGPSLAVGTMVTPAISMLFGSWRWNPATNQWQYPGATGNWRWHPADGQWQYRVDSGQWSWNSTSEEWEWGGAPGEETSEPAPPPLQFSSTFPPDAARWVYDSGSWLPPVAGAQVEGGTAPDFTGLLNGALTYHMV